MSQKNNKDAIDVKTASLKLTPRQERRVESTLAEHRHNVYNVVEIMAFEAIADVMDRMDMCTCTKCTNDVLALALNSLPQKYVTSDAGKQYIQLDIYKKQFETDVEIALMKACLIVKASPNHENREQLTTQ